MKPILPVTLLLLAGFTHGPGYAANGDDPEHKHEAVGQHAHDHDEGHQTHTKAGNDHDHNDDTHDHGEGHDHADGHGDHGSEHGDGHEHEHEEEQATKIGRKMAEQVGIETALPRSRVLNQTIVSYGSLSTGPKQLSHVRARYTGMIKSVKPDIGDSVSRGDLLARVESNESLKVYNILAPIAGIVIQRHANTGEVTQDQVLFSIANFDTLWAEFRIYPAQQSKVSAGQTVNININERVISGRIEHIIPAINKPYQLARVRFDNRALGLSPGLLVEGHIVTGTVPVTLAVVKPAIQTMGEQRGVFVQEGDRYEFKPLQLGRSDDTYTEVLGGLSAGQPYVSKNSYLIKADIEKSEAEHEH